MAPSSSPHSLSSLRKLLRTDPKPLTDQPAAPLNSASSSSTTNIPPPEKRTRDQPNLSDCHCCGRRINHTNPKDRLQPLDSIWRIVLLCRKCRKKLNSGQTCPYCFKETEHSGNLFRCCVCHRKIHKACAGEYRNDAPFCYSGVDLGFRVCVDCWVPDSLKNSIRTCGRSDNTDATRHKTQAKDSSEKTVKDANLHVDKVEMAVNDKVQALKKATAAKNTANNAKHILDFVRKKDRDEQKDASSDSSGRIKVVDDAELAFRLHRAMNSSPRMSRDKCQVNSCSDDLENGNLNGLSCNRLLVGGVQSEDQSANSAEIERNNWTDKKSLYSDSNELEVGLLVYKREKKRKTWQEIRSTLPEQTKFRLQLKHSGTGRPIKWNGDIWEILICVNSEQSGPCININRFGQNPVVYKRTRFRQKACKGNGIVKCSSFDNLTATFESQNHQSDDITHELPLVESGTVCVDRCNTGANLPRTGDVTHDLPLVQSGTVCVARCNTGANSSRIVDTTHELPLVESGTVCVASCNTEANLPRTDDITHELPLVDSGTVCEARCNSEANSPRTVDTTLELPLVDSGTVCVARCNPEANLPQTDDITHELPFVESGTVCVNRRNTEANWPRMDDITHELPLVESGTVCVARCNTEANTPRTVDTTHELPLVASGTVCLARCNTEANLPIGNCNAENDRYFLKYTRTDRGFKCCDKVILPDGSCNAESDRYFVKYNKRIKCTESGLAGQVSDTFLSAKQACAPCLIDLQAGYSEKCDGELSLPHGCNDAEPDQYFFKYVKRTKGYRAGSVVEANLHSDTELRTINLHQ